jgi:hypothetical protein
VRWVELAAPTVADQAHTTLAYSLCPARLLLYATCDVRIARCVLCDCCCTYLSPWRCADRTAHSGTFIIGSYIKTGAGPHVRLTFYCCHSRGVAAAHRRWSASQQRVINTAQPGSHMCTRAKVCNTCNNRNRCCRAHVTFSTWKDTQGTQTHGWAQLAPAYSHLNAPQSRESHASSTVRLLQTHTFT